MKSLPCAGFFILFQIKNNIHPTSPVLTTVIIITHGLHNSVIFNSLYWSFNYRFLTLCYNTVPMLKPPILHRIAGIFFLLAGIVYALPTLTCSHFSWVEIAILLCSMLPLIINKAWLHKVFGATAFLAGIILFFLLVSDHIDYIGGAVVHKPWLHFSLRYLFVFSMMLFGGLLVYSTYDTDDAKPV